jgi:hypothetical protein
MTAAAAGAIAAARTPGSRSRWVAWSSVVLYIVLAGTSLAFESRFVGQIEEEAGLGI